MYDFQVDLANPLAFAAFFGIDDPVLDFI